MKRLLMIFSAIAAFAGLTGCGGGGGGGSTPTAGVYVNAVSGNDASGDGTAGNPYKSITKALTDSNVGATGKIFVATGTYNIANGETFPIQIPANVTLEGTGPNAASVGISGGATNVTVVTLAVGSTIKKVQVQNTDPTGTTRAVLIVGGTNGAPATVDAVNVIGSGASAGHGISVNTSGLTFAVTGSTINAPASDGINIALANTTATITQNTFATGGSTAVHLATAAGAGTGVTLRSNTFNTTTAATVWVDAGVVDLGTADSGPNAGLNNFSGAAVFLRDARSTGPILSAKGNTSTPVFNCGTNVVADPGAPGWDIGTACESGVFVDPVSGSDTTGNGSNASPYKTIGFAITHAVPGLPILLKATGIYSAGSTETFPISVPAGITIQGLGASPANCRIVGGAADSTVFDIAGNGAKLKNLQVESQFSGAGQSRAVFVHGDTFTFDTCNIVNAGGGPPPNGLEFDQAGTSGTVTGCVIQTPSNTGILLNADATVAVNSTQFSNCLNGIVTTGPGGFPILTVRGCTFTGTSGAAIQVLKGSADVGTNLNAGNNTFVSCAIDLEDQRVSGPQLEAIDNLFSATPPVCGDNIIGNWSWRVTGGASGTCP